MIDVIKKRESIFLVGIIIVYFIIGFLVKNNIITYCIMLGLLSIYIVYINKFKLLSANVLFLIFYIYILGIGPIFIFGNGKQQDYCYNFYNIILGGLFAFFIGNLIGNKLNIDSKNNLKEDNLNYFKISRVWILRFLFAVSVIASGYYLYKNLNIFNNGNLEQARVDAMAGSGAILYIAQLPLIIVPMFYDIYFKYKNEEIKIVSKYEMIFLVFFSSILLLLSGFRAPLVSMYICLLILFFEKNKINSIKIVPIGVGLVVLVQLLGMIRGFLSGSSGSNIFNFLESSLTVNCKNLNYIFRAFPSRVNFQYGYTYLINFIMLKPGPDLDFTLWIKKALGMTFSGGGVTPTILGEFYINFNVISIYIGMFLLGILGVYITKYFYKHGKTFLGAFYIWQFAHCISGGIANVSIIVIFYTILYWCLMMFPIKRVVKDER